MSRYAELVNRRRLIGGERSKLMAISPMKHTWAREMWQTMNQNTWFPTEVPMAPDKQDYKYKLSDAERRLYDKALAFLSNLDGIQFNNLVDNISKHITSPEVSMCIQRQAYEEANHVDAYATMIEAVSADPMEVYMTFERDGLLAEKNEFVLKQSALLGDNYSPENFAMAVVANIIIEGIYFQSGFLAFYVLAFNGKMRASGDQIRLIQRDETTHMKLFLRMWETLQVEEFQVFTDDFKTRATELIRVSAEMEKSWARYLAKEGVEGYTEKNIPSYIEDISNDRAELMGLALPFPDKKKDTSMLWVEDFAKVRGSKKNFFEARNDSYAVGALQW